MENLTKPFDFTIALKGQFFLSQSLLGKQFPKYCKQARTGKAGRRSVVAHGTVCCWNSFANNPPLWPNHAQSKQAPVDARRWGGEVLLAREGNWTQEIISWAESRQREMAAARERGRKAATPLHCSSRPLIPFVSHAPRNRGCGNKRQKEISHTHRSHALFHRPKMHCKTSTPFCRYSSSEQPTWIFSTFCTLL